jgi:hypothetical protein
MRLGMKGFAASVVLMAVLASPTAGRATSCTMQAEMEPLDRDVLVSAAGHLAQTVASQDETALKAALLPAVSRDWEQIREAAQAATVLMKGGQIQLRSLYLLDATSLAAPADTQFFCSTASGSMTVTLTLRALPPGRYAVVLADATGAPNAGQLGFILVWDGPDSGWKLGGLTVRPGALDGHDGAWWWTRARELARDGQSWSAWYAYETARILLVPVDFLSSPNLEKLGAEQAQLKDSPQNAFPMTLPDGPRAWKIDAMRLDSSLLHAELGIVYESTGVSDLAAQRTEATAVLGAVLKAQPGLRKSFYGLWAYAVKDGKQTQVMELPMEKIP